MVRSARSIFKSILAGVSSVTQTKVLTKPVAFLTLLLGAGESISTTAKPWALCPVTILLMGIFMGGQDVGGGQTGHQNASVLDELTGKSAVVFESTGILIDSGPRGFDGGRPALVLILDELGHVAGLDVLGGLDPPLFQQGRISRCGLVVF